MVRDDLKIRTMKELGFKTDDEYFNNLDIYCDNLLADYRTLMEIRKYIETRNYDVLSIETEMRIARDMFGGYVNGRN